MMAAKIRQDRPLRVMQSFGRPRATSNPYIHMLDESLRSMPGLEHLNFDRRRALFGRYQVFHFHWPEVALGGATPIRRFMRRAYFQALLWKFRIMRTSIVRTVHNVELPTDISPWEHRMLQHIERVTDLRIAINPQTELVNGDAQVTILHGHYVDWFADEPHASTTPGLVSFVGLIRKYKGVEDLVRAFGGTAAEAPDLALLIAGSPSTSELESEILNLAESDRRIELDFGYLTEAAYAQAITRAELVVLPYRFMHNSGSVLAALSLARPVLVPRTDVNAALGSEVGPGWVYQYDGKLDHHDLIDTIARVRADQRETAPDLSRRKWSDVGEAHLAAFRTLATLARR